MKINPDESRVITGFLYYQLRSPRFRKIITETAHEANPTMKKISNQDVKDFIIHYPCLTEQQKVVMYLDNVQGETEKLKIIYQTKLHNLEELKKSILQKAFRGELSSIKELVQ